MHQQSSAALRLESTFTDIVGSDKTTACYKALRISTPQWGQGGVGLQQAKGPGSEEEPVWPIPVQKFIIAMLFCMAIVMIWSFLESASGWTIFWRAVICAVILQAAYFAGVLVLVAKRKRRRQAKATKHQETAPINPPADMKS